MTEGLEHYFLALQVYSSQARRSWHQQREMRRDQWKKLQKWPTKEMEIKITNLDQILNPQSGTRLLNSTQVS